MEFKLSEKAKKELKDIEDEIRGDMSDEEWEFVKTIRCSPMSSSTANEEEQ